jgi:hypothetical protein
MMSKIVDDPCVLGPVITCFQDLQPSNLKDLVLISRFAARISAFPLLGMVAQFQGSSVDPKNALGFFILR